MERHNAKGNDLSTFDFPKTTGKVFANKTEVTAAALSKYATNKAN